MIKKKKFKIALAFSKGRQVMDAIGDVASFVYKEVKCGPIVSSLVADHSIWQSQTVAHTPMLPSNP